MSKKTGSQMDVVLMDKIDKVKEKLEQLQQRHKLDIGALAYLHILKIEEFNLALAKLADEVNRHV